MSWYGPVDPKPTRSSTFPDGLNWSELGECSVIVTDFADGGCFCHTLLGKSDCGPLPATPSWLGCWYNKPGDECDVKLDVSGTTVLVRASAFTLINGTPVVDVLQAGQLCARGWAVGEDFSDKEIQVIDANGDGWVEYSLPPIKPGLAPYPGCPSCTNGLPFRFSFLKCGAPDVPVDGWMKYGWPGDGETCDFDWKGKDDQCTWTGSMAVSFDSTTGYVASGALTSGCD
ncbi:MAG: hypothetical protein HY914_16375 [Desulfomonile tiedjei]|nr:hypothetical protein [Desulfomonile tiedjei]